MTRHLDPVAALAEHADLFDEARLRIAIFQCGEFAQEAHENVRALTQGQLLGGADARPAEEGHVLPHGPGGCPSLRPELVGVSTPELRVTVHGAEVDQDHVAFLYEDRGSAIGAPAPR